VSFEAFVAARLAALVRFAAVLAGDPNTAQDVVQEALIRAYARWSRIEAMDQPEAFVRRMIVTEYLSWRRRFTRRRALGAAAVGARAQHIVDDHADASADRTDVLRRLAQLPRHQRAVLVLRYYEGMSTGQIADVLGCSAGAIRTYHSRAMSTLRVAAARDEHIDERMKESL
jgi:RNA polymerase sigma-70 factor (sigma-E family)